MCLNIFLYKAICHTVKLCARNCIRKRYDRKKTLRAFLFFNFRSPVLKMLWKDVFVYIIQDQRRIFFEKLITLTKKVDT